MSSGFDKNSDFNHLSPNFVFKAKRSGEYSTPDHILSDRNVGNRQNRMDYPYTKPDRPTPEEIQRRKIEMAMMNKPSPDMMKSDDKKKPAMALVISVGPKMPKKPIDTATPDKMKKYGTMKKAWSVLKENMEVGMCKNCEGTGKIPFRASQARGKFDPNPETGKIGDPCPSCGGSGSAPISDPAFAAMQQKLTGEPMDLAFRILKYNDESGTPFTGAIGASIDPKKLAEMRAARDAARRQMGQSNPNRGGDVDPI
jgi:hypothetical protein